MNKKLSETGIFVASFKKLVKLWNKYKLILYNLIIN